MCSLCLLCVVCVYCLYPLFIVCRPTTRPGDKRHLNSIPPKVCCFCLFLFFLLAWDEGRTLPSMPVEYLCCDPLSYFSFQPVLHNWCNKGRGMCYPACGMVHIKELLLLIGKSSPCGGSWFPLSLSEWSFTICPTPYNRNIQCVECVVK